MYNKIVYLIKDKIKNDLTTKIIICFLLIFIINLIATYLENKINLYSTNYESNIIKIFNNKEKVSSVDIDFILFDNIKTCFVLFISTIVLVYQKRNINYKEGVYFLIFTFLVIGSIFSFKFTNTFELHNRPGFFFILPIFLILFIWISNKGNYIKSIIIIFIIMFCFLFMKIDTAVISGALISFCLTIKGLIYVHSYKFRFITMKNSKVITEKIYNKNDYVSNIIIIILYLIATAITFCMYKDWLFPIFRLMKNEFISSFIFIKSIFLQNFVINQTEIQTMFIMCLNNYKYFIFYFVIIFVLMLFGKLIISLKLFKKYFDPFCSLWSAYIILFLNNQYLIISLCPLLFVNFLLRFNAIKKNKLRSHTYDSLILVALYLVISNYHILNKIVISYLLK